MAISRTGTAAQIEASADSGNDTVTVPNDCEAILLFYEGYNNSTMAGQSFAMNATGGGDSEPFTEGAHEGGSVGDNFAGVYYLVNPTTGDRRVDWDFDEGNSIDEGSLLILVFLKGVDTTALVVDAAAASEAGSTASSVTVSGTTSDDNVYAMLGEYNQDPDLTCDSSVTIFIDGVIFNATGYDVGEVASPANDEECGTGTGPYYPGVAAIRVKAGAGGGGVTVPALDEGMLMGGFMPLGGGFD